MSLGFGTFMPSCGFRAGMAMHAGDPGDVPCAGGAGRVRGRLLAVAVHHAARVPDRGAAELAAGPGAQPHRARVQLPRPQVGARSAVA